MVLRELKGILCQVLAVMPVVFLTTQLLWAQTNAEDNRAESPSSRVAIVIGNQNYSNVADLTNARKDAQDIAQMLRGFEFRVYDGYDLGKREFEELIRTAVLNIPDSADVLFYYAGHGIQIGRRNYLLPVDAKFESIYDVPLATMTLDRVIDTLSARSSAHVAILDSCRDNPFQDLRLAADLDANLFETREGFDVFKTPLNSLVAYSTSPGAVASDGVEGQNSPYTAAVLKTAQSSPFENIQQLFPVIREQVHKTTAGKQIPWESSTLVRPFYLAQQQAEPVQEPVVDTELKTLNLSQQFDKSVSFSEDLERKLGDEVLSLRLVGNPQRGVVITNSQSPSGSLTYAPDITDTRAIELVGNDFNDTFSVEAVTADQKKHLVEVSFELELNACDLQAGDALDLNGVGVFRLPNELDIAKGLEACTQAVKDYPGNARFLYQLARVQQAAGDFSNAFDNISAAVDGGHIRAKYALATLLWSDRIDRAVTKTPYDPEKARELLEEATAEQDPYAMHSLGKQLLRNGETEGERNRGFELLERSVELGHTFSMNELGLYFLRDNSDHYIPERGLRYLRASELRKDIYGYDNLAYVFLLGLGGNPINFNKAEEYFLAASEGGHPTAPASIARMILNEQLQGRTRAEALKWYDKSLERGDAWGGANGAYIILDGQVAKRGPADAALRAAKAALLSNEEPAAQARAQLDQISPADLNLALQMALNELGKNVIVDGQVGPATQLALENVSAEFGVPVPFSATTDPAERLLLAARVYWAQNPVRIDLF